jgi:hypothetical protein
MARPIGTPLIEERVELFVPEVWVLKSGRRRYVFLDAIQPRITALSKKVYNSNKLSARFSQLLHRNMYNTKIIYGLHVIDIDKPQKDLAVSVILEIRVSEGQDTTRKMLMRSSFVGEGSIVGQRPVKLPFTVQALNLPAIHRAALIR